MPIVIICKSRFLIQETYTKVQWWNEEKKDKFWVNCSKPFCRSLPISHSSLRQDFMLRQLNTLSLFFFVPTNSFFSSFTLSSRRANNFCILEKKKYAVLWIFLNALPLYFLLSSQRHYWIALCVRLHESGVKYVEQDKREKRNLQLYRRDSAHDNAAMLSGRSWRLNRVSLYCQSKVVHNSRPSRMTVHQHYSMLLSLQDTKQVYSISFPIRLLQTKFAV
jgi:hypothetical protein